MNDIQKSIIASIKRHCAKNSVLEMDYERWYIGITNNPPRRKQEHENEKNLIVAYKFEYWDARSSINAINIEKYFHDIDMLEYRGSRGAKKDSKYVYVFKLNSHGFDYLNHFFDGI